MKNIKIHLYLFTFLLTLWGCTTNSLDTIPQDRYTDQNFWTTQKNAMAALTGCYAVLRNPGMFDGGQATALLEETATPNAYNYTNRMGYGVIALGTHTNSNAVIFNARWVDSYRGIGRCNNLLDKIDAVPMDDGLRTRMKAEAKFLRAFYYTMLTTYFGSVPLILEAPDTEKHGKLPKTERRKIITQIVNDLDDASAILPPIYTSNDIGRATKGAALALKARVLLFEASPLNNSGDPANPTGDVLKWKAAADAAKAVIDMAPEAGYDLFPNYRRLFMPENENSVECIFDVQFKAPEQGSSFDVENRQWNENAPLQDLIDAYEMLPGFTYNAAQPYANRDLRMYQTIVFPGDTYMGSITTHTAPFKNTGYGVKKYSIYDAEPNSNIINENRSEINYMVIRYADVLLMYAEAMNEALASPDADINITNIYSAVNKIRQRGGLLPIGSGKTKVEMREIIRQERRVEFACEGLYYNDIRRWRTAESVLNATIYNSQGQPIVKRSFDAGKDYWWPVPLTQSDLNPNLK
ncbi:RagB/SusD family nutrient uptake outer membrane protein [Sphingobacterium sp. SGG-5]|uniref:RagB/SusD family nutrient uptake outer membrane protein n=1 Tax=Sphingobacterium sp. SGG-5 TaxID=2710881 RepID=UPI0013ECDB9D|nr:RagB/SusD family nutrient uptake outer membrane protein [Sphingobacterium sp. SGG-5]NGM60824.1 RagB/SusD family nutrient uptake outer membrane protein [Sphingobacterium sp. SGG-5]